MTENLSQYNKVNKLSDEEDDEDAAADDEDDDDDDDDSEEEAVDDLSEEDAAGGSESSDDDRGDSDSDDDDDNKTPPKNTSAAKAAVGSPVERRNRLQELENFVKSKSASNVKGILKGSTPSPASETKVVKFAADLKTDNDSDTPVYREDIYGRLRDQHGNIVHPDEVGVTGGQVGSYVPPGKRLKLAEESASSNIDKSSSSIDKSADESKQRVEMLTRQVKGQINR